MTLQSFKGSLVTADVQGDISDFEKVQVNFGGFGKVQVNFGDFTKVQVNFDLRSWHGLLSAAFLSCYFALRSWRRFLSARLETMLL